MSDDRLTAADRVCGWCVRESLLYVEGEYSIKPVIGHVQLVLDDGRKASGWICKNHLDWLLECQECGIGNDLAEQLNEQEVRTCAAR